MKLLFWNINKKPLLDEIKWLCDFYDVDILILAENPMKNLDVQAKLNENVRRLFEIPFSSSKRISLYSRYTFNLIADNEWGTIGKIIHPIGFEILLISVHISSKLYCNTEEQGHLSTRIVNEINFHEQMQNHTQTIVMGDFNMNPFDAGMISSEGFHAVMDKNIALKKFRKVLGQQRNFFYNPLWSRLGDNSTDTSGTYYYNSSGILNYFWNTFDQVLIRPSLLPTFNDSDLKIIDMINNKSLIKKGKISKKEFSDHLPLLIELKISKLTLENNS